MRLQRTIKREVSVKGIGLHTGRECSICLMSAPRDTGIVFIRKDKGGAAIKANLDNVINTSFATNLGVDGVRVNTTEHILSALAGLKIDNVYIEVDGPEIPIMDGSAFGYVNLIIQAGIAKQGKNVPYLRITKPIAHKEGQSEIAIVPYEGMRISYRVYFNHLLIGEQTLGIDITESNFVKEIAPARTFGFLDDVKALRKMGLAMGGSLDNAIVIGKDRVLNEEGLRYADEFVRHKILDAVGDFSLGGIPIEGHIIANRSGHYINIKFMRKILSAVDCWKIISSEDYQATAKAAVY